MWLRALIAGVIVLAAVGYALAQPQPAPGTSVADRLKATIGELAFQNAMLAEQNSSLAAANAALQKEVEDLKAKQNQPADKK
jgi:uncharacterized protein (DUF3084 family)